MHMQRRRNSGRTGGALKQLKAMETYEKQKIVTKYVCFYSTKLTSKLMTKIIENHSEFSGCRIAAIDLFQVDLDKP